MKKLFLLFVMFSSFSLFSQRIETFKSKPFGGNYCTSSKMVFTLKNKFMERLDVDYGVSTSIPAGLVDTKVDEQGLYYELYSPTYYLKEFGIDEYNKTNHMYTYWLVYLNKGGVLLYVFEYEIKKGMDSGTKFYTNHGVDLYCH